MFGRYIWERYMLRVKVLEEWQRMLIEINGEINYSAQACHRYAGRCQRQVFTEKNSGTA